MKWLEIIKLRSAGNGDGLRAELLRFIAEVDQEGGSVSIKAYRHAALESDLSVHLRWESDGPDQHGSALGLRLVQSLKEFGLIDHSVWIEEEKSVLKKKEGMYHV